MIKRILTITGVVAFSAGLLFLMARAWVNRQKEIPDRVVIEIDGAGDQGFLEPEAIMELVNPKDTLLGTMVKALPLRAMESQLLDIPFVSAADCYSDMNGDVRIHIRERRPILRIYEQQGNSYYIDEQGIIFPVSTHFAPRVLIANGYIPAIYHKNSSNIHDTLYDSSLLPPLYNLTRFLLNDPFWKAQINQVYLNSLGEWELIPEYGRHIVRLGSLDNLEEKMNNLRAFYGEMAKTNRWDEYKTVNLKFKNQIVCTKK